MARLSVLAMLAQLATAHLRRAELGEQLSMSASVAHYESQAAGLTQKLMNTVTQKAAIVLTLWNPPAAQARPSTTLEPVLTFWDMFFFLILEALILTAFAYLYLKNRTVPAYSEGEAAKKPDFDDWAVGFCSCLDDPKTCFMGFCCPCVRWAESVSMVKGLLKFWPAFLISIALLTIGDLLLAGTGELIMVIIFVVYRQNIRKKFEFKSVGGMTYVTDCLLYLCGCACCAIIQEARHVEKALECGRDEVALPEGRKESYRDETSTRA